MKYPPHHVRLIIRGVTFRSTDADQFDCLYSVVKHIVTPLKRRGFKVSMCLCVYRHEKNYLLLDYLNKIHSETVELFEFSKVQYTNQVDSFIAAIENNVGRGSLLIVRSDIVLLRAIDVDGIRSDNIGFQWCYPHNKYTYEYADQFHFIGGEHVGEYLKTIKSAGRDLYQMADGTGRNTLHNLFNVVGSNRSLSNNVCYLFDVSHIDVEYDVEGNCNLRGNPDASGLNNLYEYRRVKKTDPLWQRIIRKLRIK